jgi:hypothetical protein
MGLSMCCIGARGKRALPSETKRKLLATGRDEIDLVSCPSLSKLLRSRSDFGGSANSGNSENPASADGRERRDRTWLCRNSSGTLVTIGCFPLVAVSH